MDVRRGVAGLGRTMIAAGTLILLFVAYQLWGTGLAEARSQRALTRSFEQSLADGPEPTITTTSTTEPVSPTTGPAPVTTAVTAPATTAAREVGPPPAPPGAAVAILKIPRLGVEKAVVQGVTLGLLKKGPGHYPGTPMPGQPGNAAIAGHRTTYGAPFYRLNELDPGDPILVTTRQGSFRYEVTRTLVVRPDQTSVLQPSTENLLTLTTCHPRFSAAQRLIVVATLKGGAVPAPPPAAPPPAAPPPAAPPEPAGPGGTAPEPTTPAVTTAPAGPTGFEDDGEAGLSGRNAANGPAVAWGMAAAAVWLLTWLAGRQWRRWPAYVIGTPVFLVVLFVFFENFSRLLPSNF